MVSRDHPRSRGENIPFVPTQEQIEGSSPLTRGKRGLGGSAPPALGIIPAHAGKTLVRASPRQSPEDHPRSRGENFIAKTRPFVHPGSSPLTRGKLTARLKGCAHAGIIPAHAGKTSSGPHPRTAPGDHPRSRGENCCEARPAEAELGSSPLTRGKRCGHCRQGRDRGIIPAHAGKTTRRCSRLSMPRDHPRSRGENFESFRQSVETVGSSPLTRGKHDIVKMHRAGFGIIPAHAGKTSRTLSAA